MISWTYDAEVDAVYVQLTDQPVGRTVDHDDDIMVDHDPAGNLRGVEVLGASQVDLRRVAGLSLPDDYEFDVMTVLRLVLSGAKASSGAASFKLSLAAEEADWRPIRALVSAAAASTTS